MSNPDFNQLFGNVSCFAVVGYSDNKMRAGHFVPAYLREQGYTVVAVNPKFIGEVDGFPCYPSLSAVPAEYGVDVIDVFRAPEHLPQVLEDALQMTHRPRYFWMQPGAENEAVAQAATAEGFIVVKNACALAEHRRLMSDKL
jgi:predicted CoA-binding protein